MGNFADMANQEQPEQAPQQAPQAPQQAPEQSEQPQPEPANADPRIERHTDNRSVTSAPAPAVPSAINPNLPAGAFPPGAAEEAESDAKANYPDSEVNR